MRKKFRNSKGFTLVELLAAVGIVGILTGTSIGVGMTQTQRGHDSTLAQAVARITQTQEFARASEDGGFRSVVVGSNKYPANSNTDIPSVLQALYAHSDNVSIRVETSGQVFCIAAWHP